MPHHKECWVENQGCTTFGCSGTIQNASQSINQKYVNATRLHGASFCTRCSSPVSPDVAFCSNCGNQIAAQLNAFQQYHYSQQNINAYANSLTEEDMYIKQKIEYYKPRFNALRPLNEKVSWNWCAFLFSPYWLIYRKMYGWGLGVLAAQFFINIIGYPFSILSIGISISIGILGNYLYLKRIDNLVEVSKNLSEQLKSQLINKNAGVNLTATVLTITGYFLLILFLDLSR